MDVNREVALELALAGLLKAAGIHREDLIQRANAAILGGKVDAFAGGAEHKTAACSAIYDIAGRI